MFGLHWQASLDQAGGAAIWTCIELKEGDNAGSETDLGLGIGGRVKLIKSTVIQDPATSIAYSLAFHPEDTNEYLVASSAGMINRFRRFGEGPNPNVFMQSSDKQFADACQVVSCFPLCSFYFFSQFPFSSSCSLFLSTSNFSVSGPLSSFCRPPE